MPKLIIHRFSNRMGQTYSLPPESKNLICSQFGRLLSDVRRVFLGLGPEDQTLTPAQVESLLELLTTLSATELRSFEIEIVETNASFAG